MATATRAREMPPFLQQNSRGRIADLLYTFLCGAGLGEGLVPDQVYGPKMVVAMVKFQELNSLDADGGCGPKTREVMKSRYDFDLVAVYENSHAHDYPLSVFVQPDGRELLF